MTGERHTVPPYTGEWKAQAPEARIRFAPSVERWVRERQPFTFVREELESGGPLFVYAIRQERELISWLLSWGSAVEVLDPPGLRSALAAEAQEIAFRHGSAPDIRLSRAREHAEVAI